MAGLDDPELSSALRRLREELRANGVRARDVRRHFRELRRNGFARANTECDGPRGAVFYVLTEWRRGHYVTRFVR